MLNPYIMVGNDDGIMSLGIDALAHEARKLGEIRIVAPITQQTARAKSLTFHRPIRVNEAKTISGIPALAYNSTPAVSIIIHNHFYSTPDVVLSGINSGDNTSIHSILTSGTAAVAMEAGLLGIKSFAFSMDVPDKFFYSNDVPGNIEIAAKWSIIIAKAYLKASKQFWTSIMFINVNFPNQISDKSEVVVTELESSKYTNYLHSRQDPKGEEYFWLWGTKREDLDEKKDSYAVYEEKKISITPVIFDHNPSKFSKLSVADIFGEAKEINKEHIKWQSEDPVEQEE